MCLGDGCRKISGRSRASARDGLAINNGLVTVRHRVVRASAERRERECSAPSM